MEVLELPAAICATAKREMNFDELYETAFPRVAAFVSKLKGSFEDAKDIFQDALVIYMEKSADRHFLLQTSPEQYVLGIAKHLWLRKFKRDRSKISLDAVESTISLPNDPPPEIESKRILRFLEITGKKCLDLLVSFYYERLTMNEICNSFGYGSVHSATVQKYKCLEKVRDVIKEKSVTYEDFYE